MAVEVDPLCNRPGQLWEQYLQSGRICRTLDPKWPTEPCAKDSLRFVCIADTHNALDRMASKIPDGDVLIHAGDFTNCGSRVEVEDFNEALGKLPHTYKVVIAGNHEFGFDDGPSYCPPPFFLDSTRQHGYQLLSNCVYLQDSETEIFGIRIFGSPWHPLKGFPFFCKRGKSLLKKWNLIPAGIDILVTHSPPLGHMDKSNFGGRLGCSELLNTVEKRVRPKYHVFGHVHEQHGFTTNGVTTFVNASMIGLSSVKESGKEALVFDLPKYPRSQPTPSTSTL